MAIVIIVDRCGRLNENDGKLLKETFFFFSARPGVGSQILDLRRSVKIVINLFYNNETDLKKKNTFSSHKTLHPLNKNIYARYYNHSHVFVSSSFLLSWPVVLSHDYYYYYRAYNLMILLRVIIFFFSELKSYTNFAVLFNVIIIFY